MSAAGWCVALVVVVPCAWAHVRARRLAAEIARVGHEIRGPLCAALLGLEPLGTGEHAPRVAAVELELRRAALAVEDLGRRRSAREAGGRAHDVVDVGALLRDAATAWRAVASAHGARLAVEAPPGLGVRAERLRLAQACGNLVANAAEHGGGDVRVRARALGGAVRVEVTDDGPGLPAPVDVLLTRARRRAGRRGHGLAVAAQVARHHGGRLSAGPSPRGARLVLELPAAPGTERVATPSP
jgi:signal transduction histidine kinase